MLSLKVIKQNNRLHFKSITVRLAINNTGEYRNDNECGQFLAS